MCNYCNGKSEDRYISIFKDNEGDYILSIESCNSDYYYGENDYTSIQIDYCPFCGEKLK